MKTKAQYIEQLHSLLERTSLQEEEYLGYITNPFVHSFRDDFAPFVELTDRGYILTMYERGHEVFYKKINDEDTMLYWILAYTIELVTHIRLLHKYKVDNKSSFLTYDEQLVAEWNADQTKVFDAIGGIYAQWWHEKGKRGEIEAE